MTKRATKPKPLPVYATHDGTRRLMVAARNKREACKLLGCSERDFAQFGRKMPRTEVAAIATAQSKPGAVWWRPLDGGWNAGWQLRGGGGTIGGSSKGAAPTVGRKRTREPDLSTPEGQCAKYLQHLTAGRDIDELAKTAKVSRGSMFNYLAGTTAPDVDVLDRIAKAMGLRDYRDLMPTDEFLAGIGQRPKRRK